MWAIEVTLDGNPLPLELCKCTTPESVTAVILSITRSEDMRPVTVRRLAGYPLPLARDDAAR